MHIPPAIHRLFSSGSLCHTMVPLCHILALSVTQWYTALCHTMVHHPLCHTMVHCPLSHNGTLPPVTQWYTALSPHTMVHCQDPLHHSTVRPGWPDMARTFYSKKIYNLPSVLDIVVNRNIKKGFFLSATPE